MKKSSENGLPIALAGKKKLIVLWFWSPLPIMFAKCGQNPPRKPGQEQTRKRKKARLKTRHSIHWKWPSRTQATHSAQQRSVQVTERQAWRPALLWHLWDREWWPQAGLKWGAGPWALYGPREASQDYWRLVVPSEPWEKKEKRTCWDQSIWSAIRH